MLQINRKINTTIVTTMAVLVLTPPWSSLLSLLNINEGSAREMRARRDGISKSVITEPVNQVISESANPIVPFAEMPYQSHATDLRPRTND